jgi:hypothetical protein
MAKGLIAFAKGVPATTINLLAKNQSLRNALLAIYTRYQVEITNLKKSKEWLRLSSSVRERVIMQDNFFRRLVGLEKTYYLPRFSRAVISEGIGFTDVIDDLLKKEGLTREQFISMIEKTYKELSESEKIQLNRIRAAFLEPDKNTILQKVIPNEDLELYLNGDYDEIRGFVTKAADTKNYKTPEDYYYGLRLDYGGSRFKNDADNCFVIRFTTPNVDKIGIPRGTEFDKIPYPFSNTGFTAGSKNRMGVPEWQAGNLKMDEGAEIWKINSDGKEEIVAVYKKVGNEYKFEKQ